MGKLAGEKAYDEGQDLEKKQNYEQAMLRYKKKDGALTLLAQANLYCSDKWKSNDPMQIDKGFQCLQKLFTNHILREEAQKLFQTHSGNAAPKIQSLITALNTKLKALEKSTPVLTQRDAEYYSAIIDFYSPEGKIKEKLAKLLNLLSKNLDAYTLHMTMAVIDSRRDSQALKSPLHEQFKKWFNDCPVIAFEIGRIYEKTAKKNNPFLKAENHVNLADSINQLSQALQKNPISDISSIPSFSYLLEKNKLPPDQIKNLSQQLKTHYPSYLSAENDNAIKQLFVKLPASDNIDIEAAQEWLKKAAAQLTLWTKTGDFLYLEKALDCYKESLINGDVKKSLDEIIRWRKLKYPTANAILIDLLLDKKLPFSTKLQIAEQLSSKNTQVGSPTRKKSDSFKEDVKRLANEGREWLEAHLQAKSIKLNDKVINAYSYAGLQFCRGGTLCSYNPVIAREFFELAVTDKSYEHSYYLAKLYLNADGGAQDVARAQELLRRTKPCQLLEPEVNYLKGNLSFILWKDAQHSSNSNNNNNNNNHSQLLNDCINFWNQAAKAWHVEAVQSLYMLYQFDSTQQVLPLLCDIYKSKAASTKLSTIDFPGFPKDKSLYHVHLGWLYYQQTKEILDLPGLKEYCHQQETEQLKKIQLIEELRGKFDKDDSKQYDTHRTIIESNESVLKTLCNENNSVALWVKACYELHCKDNPLPMRQIKDTQFLDRAVKLLCEYYVKENTSPLQNALISSLCYEAKRHELGGNAEFQSMACMILQRVLIYLNNKYQNYALEDFQRHIESEETTTKQYFVEYPSDDSDSENESSYQGRDNSTSAKRSSPSELVNSLLPDAKKFLKSIEELAQPQHNNEKKYTDLITCIQSTFFKNAKSAYKLKSKQSLNDKVSVRSELNHYNHYSSNNNKLQAAKKIFEPFRVALTRGINYNQTKFNKPLRNQYAKQITHADHPFNNKPMYADAVYQLAGVKYVDSSETARLRLEKMAQLLLMRMGKLRQPGTRLDESILNGIGKKKLTEKPFADANEQFQELYTNDYAAVHQYYKQSMSQPNSPFISEKTPILSFSAMPSPHSMRYAAGNKFYEGHKEERLRPQYQADGRLSRKHVGAITLSLHPLHDFATSSHNDVVELVTKEKITVDLRILQEHEISFYALIKANRIIFTYDVKFPSFHHEQYKKTFSHYYGIDEEFYLSIKQLIQNSEPHGKVRQALIFLLSEYLAT